jgi:hypothetical protein
MSGARDGGQQQEQGQSPLLIEQQSEQAMVIVVVSCITGFRRRGRHRDRGSDGGRRRARHTKRGGRLPQLRLVARLQIARGTLLQLLRSQHFLDDLNRSHSFQPNPNHAHFEFVVPLAKREAMLAVTRLPVGLEREIEAHVVQLCLAVVVQQRVPMFLAAKGQRFAVERRGEVVGEDRRVTAGEGGVELRLSLQLLDVDPIVDGRQIIVDDRKRIDVETILDHDPVGLAANVDGAIVYLARHGMRHGEGREQQDQRRSRCKNPG